MRKKGARGLFSWVDGTAKLDTMPAESLPSNSSLSPPFFPFFCSQPHSVVLYKTNIALPSFLPSCLCEWAAAVAVASLDRPSGGGGVEEEAPSGDMYIIGEEGKGPRGNSVF